MFTAVAIFMPNGVFSLIIKNIFTEGFLLGFTRGS